MRIPRLGLAFVSATTGKLLGFLRVQAIAITLGASALTDALLMSLTVLTIFDIVVVSGSAILLAQAAYIARHSRGASRTALALYARSTARWLLLSAVFGVIIALLGDPISRVVAPGFDDTARRSFVHLCAIGALIPLATALMVFTSTLNRFHGREVLYTVNPLGINGLSLLSLLACQALGYSPLRTAEVLVLSTLASTLLMAIWQTLYVGRDERALGLALLLRELISLARMARVAQFGREVGRNVPLIASVLLQQVLVIISYAFASGLGQGALTVIGVGERITNVIFALTVTTFLLMLEPTWARAFAAKNRALGDIHDDILVISLVLIPLATIILVTGDSIATLLFGHGAFAGAAAEQLGDVVRAFGLSLPSMALALLYARLLVIANRARGIVYANAGLAVMHAALCFTLTPHLGVVAIPLSLASAMALQAIATWWLLPADFRHSGLPRGLARLSVVAAFTLAASYGVGKLVSIEVLRVACVSAVAAAVTLLSARIVNIPLRNAVRRLANL